MQINECKFNFLCTFGLLLSNSFNLCFTKGPMGLRGESGRHGEMGLMVENGMHDFFVHSLAI